MAEKSLSRRAIAAASLALALPLTRARAAAAGQRSRPLSADDRLAIEDLYVRYAWCYDCNDEQSFISLFTEDAIVVGYPEMHEIYKSREAILSWFRFLTQMREKEGDDWQHVAYNHRFDGDAARCVVYSYATHFNSNSEKKVLGVRSAGLFVCECLNTSAGWRYRRFSINHWDRKQVPWTKPLPWAHV